MFYAYLGLVALDGLLGLGVVLVGVVQSDLQLIDVALQLLLDCEGLCPAPCCAAPSPGRPAWTPWRQSGSSCTQEKI